MSMVPFIPNAMPKPSGSNLRLPISKRSKKRLDTARKQEKAGKTKELTALIEALERAKTLLSDGKALRDEPWTADIQKELRALQLLTFKPMLYVVNVSEEQLADGSWNERMRTLVSAGAKWSLCA